MQIHPSNILGSKILDHLGLVAATIDQLGIAHAIDKRLPLTKGSKTTHSQRVIAMILNGLGFIDHRLYLFPKFIENKPISKLFGNQVKADDFNDDALGRCLDAIHDYGETKFFSEIALTIALQHNILGKSAHLDTTTLTLYGDYACAETDEVDEVKNSTAVAETNRLTLPKLARPAHGYAKNKRFDLKQMTLLLATSGAAHFPIWMEAHAGNAADKTTLEAAATRMQNFCKALESTPSFLYVGDSAMYANCVKYGQNLLWLSRVPDNIKVAKTLLTKQTIDWIELDKGYKYIVVNQIYQGIAQRWALIYSKEAYDKEVVTLEKKIEKEASETNKLLWHLGNQLFGCLQDLDKEILQINKKLHYHKISYTAATIPTYLRKGRPKKDNKPDKIEYKAHTVLLRDEEKIEHATLSKGRFILATNQLDEIALKDSEILSTYKEQSGTESGFKFIKDNSFEVDSIFLKKPGRISALMVVMTLCLMVYSFAQYDLRKQLEATNTTILSQSGYATKKPTMKWIYKLFHGVHLLKIKIGEQYHEIVLNMNDILKKIVQHFGPMACRIYDIEYENI